MSVIKNCVLLLKSQKGDEGDGYEEKLATSGYSVRYMKTLIFEYKDLSSLAKKLSNPDDYSGIILSSPRCVNAVRLALEGRNLDVRWKSKENFVVGEATLQTAANSLGLICRGSETGNANNLARLIINEKANFSKPFLFPHGNLKTDTLYKHFKEASLSLDETLVYETISNPNVKEEFSVVSDNFTALPEYVVFFSPSGVQSTLASIKMVSVDWSSVKFIAIGPVTEERMRQECIPVNGVAAKPNPDSVLEVISKLN